MGAGEEVLPGGGEADGARGAMEERCAEKIFETADLLRERGLREMETGGGATEVQIFGDGYEVSEVTEFKILIHRQYQLMTQNKILDASPALGETAEKGGFWMATEERGLEGGVRRETGGWTLRAYVAGSADAAAFRALNVEWIALHFALEAKDVTTLGDPEGTILRKGGRILVAEAAGGAVVGCVALIPMGGEVVELSKMAVAPEMRGRGLGRRLLEGAVAEARAMGARRMFLGSNTKLADAVHLYESAGFRHVERERLPEMPYTRANVFMEREV